jgi:predicted DsbA family dithiol-disulfide isomerase
MKALLKTVKTWWTLYKLSKELNKEVDSNIDIWFNTQKDNTFTEDQERHYFQGMLNLKHEVKRRAKEGSLSLEAVLAQAGERLLEFARKETKEQEQFRKLAEAAYFRDGKDIKTEKDKEDMINGRIADYVILRKKKLQREINQKMRKAYKEQDFKTYNKLKKEMESINGLR